MAEVRVLKNKKDQFEYLKEVQESLKDSANDQGLIKLGKVEELFSEVLAAFEPRQGGGVSKNPPKEIDGIMYHFCRHLQDYVPENEIIMSQGKAKGASIYANKYFFKLEKDVQKLKDDALIKLVSGDPELIAEGTEMHVQASEIELSRTNPETYKTEEFQAFKEEVVAKEQEKEAERLAEENKTEEEGK